MLKLKDRIESYQDSSDYKLLNRVPIIISANGRSFNKLTSLLDKPFCQSFSEAMISVALKLCNDIEGAIFAYQCNDQIIIVARNDQNIETSPWYDNRIQKLCSITSAMATSHFSKITEDLSLMGDGLFTSQVFVVPNLAEAVNTLIYKQQQQFHVAIQSACVYELLKKYNKNTISEMLEGLSLDEKVDLLSQECEIDFDKYPIAFRRGIAVYKVPKVVENGMKTKWFVNAELPIFAKDQSFLNNLFKNNGIDVFRSSSL